MEFSDFIKSVKKVNSNRNHKIKNSFGIANAYVYYTKNIDKKNYKKVSRIDFGLIINLMNKIISDSIICNKKFTIPSGLGLIEILKNKTESKILDNGDFFCNKPKDIMATLRLWYDDKDSFESKSIVRHDTDYIFRFRYIKKNCRYKNSAYFFIKFNRGLKQKLKNNINNNEKYDTYEYRMDEYKNNLR